MGLQEIQERLELKKAKDRESALKARVAEQEERILDLEAELEVAFQVKNSDKKTAFTPAKVGKNMRGDCIAHMIASDWHLEEKVDPATVSGLNEYNLAVAAGRAQRFFDKGLWLCELASRGLYVRGLVVALLGDLITGQHREEAIENNLLSPPEAVEFAFDLLRAGFKMLKKEAHFSEPIVVACCSGNHGRTVDKPRASTREKHSFEWMLYRALQRELQDGRMKFEIATGYHLNRKEYGHTIRYHHGDALKYNGGIGGITIPATKAIHSWNRGTPATLDVFGHFHTQMDGACFLANGSMIGANAYAVRIKAAHERPQQTFFLLDKENGKILTAPIFVTEGKNHAK
jgi:hypothetical protein